MMVAKWIKGTDRNKAELMFIIKHDELLPTEFNINVNLWHSNCAWQDLTIIYAHAWMSKTWEGGGGSWSQEFLLQRRQVQLLKWWFPIFILKMKSKIYHGAASHTVIYTCAGTHVSQANLRWYNTLLKSNVTTWVRGGPLSWIPGMWFTQYKFRL